MRRPLPTLPRGPRLGRPRLAILLLTCPRLAPPWEFAALAALVKPQLASRLKRQNATQSWSLADSARHSELLVSFSRAFDFVAESYLPDAGDFHLVVKIPREQLLLGRALAVYLSLEFADRWFVFDRLYLFNGHFYRRTRGYKMHLKPAGDVHLPREMRLRLQRVLLCKTNRSND